MMYQKSQLFTDTFFNKNNEFKYFIYIDTKFVLVVNFRSDWDTHTTAREKGQTTANTTTTISYWYFDKFTCKIYNDIIIYCCYTK